jgi:hypothetical protein
VTIQHFFSLVTKIGAAAIVTGVVTFRDAVRAKCRPSQPPI